MRNVEEDETGGKRREPVTRLERQRPQPKLAQALGTVADGAEPLKAVDVELRQLERLQPSEGATHRGERVPREAAEVQSSSRGGSSR
jgi:hypothetical protein